MLLRFTLAFFIFCMTFVSFDSSAQDQAEIHFVAAREYYKSGNINLAIAEADSAILINPQYAEAHYLLADIYAKESEYESALKQYTETISNNPKLAQAYADRASIHYKLEHHQNYLISDMENAIYLDPGNGEYYRLKAFYYANTNASNEFEPSLYKAISTINEAIAFDPQKAIYYFDRGNYKFKNNQILSAMADLNKAVTLNPTNSDFLAKRGLVRFMIEDFDASLTDYTQAINLDPDNARLYESRGKTKHNMGNYNSAYNDYTYAIELLIYNLQASKEKIKVNDPRNKQLAGVLLLRGVSLVQENKPFDACIDFDRAYQLGAQKAANYIRRYCEY